MSDGEWVSLCFYAPSPPISRLISLPSSSSSTSSSSPNIMSSTDRPKSTNEVRPCSGPNCLSSTDVPVHACMRCKSINYCGRVCQKKHWDSHKHRCFSPNTPRLKVSERTIDAINSAVHGAEDGTIIVLEEGTYQGSGSLWIKKPIVLLGAGKDSTKVCCDGLVIKADANDECRSNQSVTIADVEVTNSSNITAKYNTVNLCGVRFTCPIGSRHDAVETGSDDGKILFLDCEITGGCDGLSIFGQGVRLKRTIIKHAACRGIFSRHNFVIENVTISHCGSYGIKGTAGWDEKGKNSIQPGPWSRW